MLRIGGRIVVPLMDKQIPHSKYHVSALAAKLDHQPIRFMLLTVSWYDL